MLKLVTLICAGAAIGVAPIVTPGFAQTRGAGDFTIVNMSGADWQSLSIRRYGTQDWRPLGPIPAQGSKGVVQFSDPDCAFDVRADIAGEGALVWTGVNVCQTKAVILNRNARGATWVDYE